MCRYVQHVCSRKCRDPDEIECLGHRSITWWNVDKDHILRILEMGEQSKAEGASVQSANAFGQHVAAVELHHRRYAQAAIAAQQIAQAEDEQVLWLNHPCESRGR